MTPGVGYYLLPWETADGTAVRPGSLPALPWCFRRPSDRHAAERLRPLVADEVLEEPPVWKHRLVCRQCRQLITGPDERIDVQGSHRHTFSNPYGVLYQIGCFRAVRGCVYTGPATREWSWFRGFRWRIAVCSQCLTHLGWLFCSTDTESFHGLILSRLVQDESDHGAGA